MIRTKFLSFVLLTLLGTFQLPALAEELEWVSAKGNAIRAEFVSADADTVTIAMRGKTYVLKLADLSPESRALARKLATNAPHSIASGVDHEAMVRGVAKAFAAQDYGAFRKFTCLGMGKDEFKQFMAKNDDRKVVRTWDPALDDFQEELIVGMQKAYAEILQEAREKGFDWSQAKVVECERDDDVKARLRSGKVELYLHLDDCFMTPQGLLSFDAPRAWARELAEPNRPAIGFSVMTLAHPFFGQMVAGMQAEADQRGAELQVEDAQIDVKKQSDQIDAFIAQKVDVIVLAPVDRVRIGPAIKSANSAGIPVFTVDAECTAEGVKITGHVGTDNFQGGQLAGQAMIEALGPKGGKVLVLGFKIANACVQRVEGFREVIDVHNKKGEGGAIEIVAEVDGEADQRPSEQATADALIDHPDLTGIFAINDPSALGAYQAARAAGKEKQLKIIGFDGTKQGRDAIKAGKIYAASIQFPDRMGRRVIKNVFAHLTGREVKQVDLVPTEIYRQEDALAEEGQASVQAPAPISEELLKTLLDRVWKDKNGRLIMATFVSLVEDNLTISMKGKPFEVKLSYLSPESQSLARALALSTSDRKLSAGDAAKLFASEIGTWKINGYQQPEGGEREAIEDVMEIRWKEKGKSFEATFSPLINGKKVPFVGTKEYDAQSGFFVWRSKGEGFPPGISYECYDPVSKTYHGKSSYPDGAMEFGSFSMIDEDRHSGKFQIFVEGELVYTRQMNFLRVSAGQVRKGDKLRLAFVTNGIAGFWNVAKSGCLDAQRDLGVEVVVKMPSQFSVVQQKQMVESLLADGIDGIAISPLDADNQTAWLNGIAAQVPLITHDADAPESKRRVYLGMDNYKAGRMCGELVKKALPNGGGVMLFVGRLEQENAKQRRQGVIDELFGRPVPESRGKIAHDPVAGVLDGGKYKILGTAVDALVLARAKQKADAAIAAYPDMKAMVGLFEYNLPACYQALKQAGKLGKIKLVGFDANDVTLQGIKEGFVTGTIVQNPSQYGYQSIKVLKEIIEGKDNLDGKDYIDIVGRKITKENVDAYWIDLQARVKGEWQSSGPQPEPPAITAQDINTGNFAEVKRKLEQGADANVFVFPKASALHWSCNLGRVNIVRLLLANGANPNALNGRKMTPLDVLFSTDQKGRTSLDRMSAQQQAAISIFLKKAGGKRSLRTAPVPE